MERRKQLNLKVCFCPFCVTGDEYRRGSKRNSGGSRTTMRSEAFVACTVQRLHLRPLRVFTCVDGVRGTALFHCGILNAKNRLVYYCIVAIRGSSADKRPGCVASGTYSNISFLSCSSHLNMVIMRTEIDELRSCVQTRNGGERGREEKRKIILKGIEPPHPPLPIPILLPYTWSSSLLPLYPLFFLQSLKKWWK